MSRQIFLLVIIISIRFFGLFIVLPVISLYAQSFENISALMVGLIIGGAYLTQLLFQTPLGILSDRYNRKIIIFIGLAIFLLGSVICAFAKTPEWLVVGRLIQGMGAVGGIVSAQITDITREEQRTKAMAVMGGCIFASFILAMIVGPIIGGHIGASWLFGITALFTFCSILLLYKVPQSPKLTYSFDTKENTPKETRNKNLWIMNLSSFLEKALMTLVFVVVPLISFDHFHIIEQDLWKIYVPSAILAIFAMGPASILAEKYNKPKLVLFLGISCFLLAYLLFAYSENILWMFVCGILIFFVGFAMLEPIMQSLASKYAKHICAAGLLEISLQLLI
ncbi:multidrug-efflux protein [Helicobacter mustelae]|uniref:MFS transporter n=1 Tax=Helicobacter mustelae TaxID=217 RepID=UPI000DF93B54|nr:MFS transporter [Helicobacter mustelae]STP12840.1 multidrug-efflux protein [Helicobacter mustelae]